MIEWIVGAAVVGGLLFGGEQKKERAPTFRLTRLGDHDPQPVPNIDEHSNYSEWRAEWNHKVDRTRWIPKGLAKEIVQSVPPYQNGNSKPKPTSEQSGFEEALRAEFDEHNSSFGREQKKKLRSFFSSVERNPLSDEQMDSCICMDEAIQIIAAAGSGKTSTIVARIGYALKQGLARPEQILVLAFNRSVKEELLARIKERLSDLGDVERITVQTFNAFGLEVIGKSTDRKPRLADWVEPGRDVEAISEIIEHLRETDPKFRLEWDIFRTVYACDVGDWGNLEQPIQSHILTADGTYVKSDEERVICDFLYYYGVQYQYERAYEHDTATDSHSQYHPDFYYPRIQLYHEHFALDAEGNAPPHFSRDYVSGVLWKRALHTKMETQLFETTSDGLRNGDDLDKLMLELVSRGEALEFDESRPSKGQEPITEKQLASTLRVFQQHVKSNDLSYRDLRQAVESLEHGHRNRLNRFLNLYERIADEWQRRLSMEESVDFDDMLLLANEHIEKGSYRSPFTMVLADEFQDVSQAKLRLLKGLKKSVGQYSTLCVVGDDWQGINRFAGADISVMTGFDKTFPEATQLTLSKTFRCPKVICDASSDFIQKNPRQLRKTVETTNTYRRSLLSAFAAETPGAAIERLEKDLKQLHRSAENGDLEIPVGTKVSVMLLGRYNKDKPTNFNSWQRAFSDQINLAFSTAHAAKGLEADYVMLLNVTEGFLGFPSQIVDDPVLQLAMPEPDPYPMAEERRLFYVALTRARRQTRIYTLRDKLSRFVTELAHDGHLEIRTSDGILKICPKCGKGTLNHVIGKYGAFEACSAYPKCKHKQKNFALQLEKTNSSTQVRLTKPITQGETCPICNRGTMIKRTGRNGKPFLGCTSFPKCRATAPFQSEPTGSVMKR